MGQAENIAVGEIERARGDLDRDLSALEARFRRETDWRVQFDRRPWLFLSAGFGLGFALSMMLGKKDRVEVSAGGR